MKKFNFSKLISFVLVCVMLMGTFAIDVFAEGSDAAPAAEIISENVYFGDTLQLMFAIKNNGGVDYDLTVTGPDGVDIPMESFVDDSEEAPDADLYRATIGVPAQDIAKEVVVKVTVDGDVVDQKNYSVLEYLYTRLLVSDNVTEAQKTMYNALLAYADAADIAINQTAAEASVANYKLVRFTNVTLNGDDAVIVTPGALDLSSVEGIDVPDGYKLVWSVEEYNDSGANVGTSKNVEEIEVDDNHLVLTASAIDASVAVETQLAVFELGADNSSKSNSESSSDKATYTESVNGYTLNITGASKMYAGSYDINGEGCIKLGSSSVAGTFTFKVDENVTKVVIKIAGRQSKTGAVIINDVTYSDLPGSNTGYEDIEIDTTTTKTITLKTVKQGSSGDIRAMMNSITFYGFAK